MVVSSTRALWAASVGDRLELDIDIGCKAAHDVLVLQIGALRLIDVVFHEVTLVLRLLVPAGVGYPSTQPLK
jgi:hypothetical protein